jgi:phosphoribosylformimino-5-aminoimidazole carboxamide ribotide isomerase
MGKGFDNDGRLTVIPAIDLKGGKCVRLRQGVASDATVYGDDPVAMARRWRDEGGRALHVVDLDGAFAGHPAHLAEIGAIAAALDIPVEVGGGLRTDDDVRVVLDLGVARAIIGTRALSDPAALARLVSAFGGDRIAVGIDARNGLVQVNGWVETTSARATDLARRVAGCGVGAIIYTDTATDGMLSGPNLPALAEIADAAPQCRIVASGGVSSPADIAAIAALGRPNVTGAIVGKALYDGRATLSALIAAATGGPQ